jgi:hypothetical protein
MTTTLNSEPIAKSYQSVPWCSDPHDDPTKKSRRYTVPWIQRHFAFDYAQGRVIVLPALYDHNVDAAGIWHGCTERANSIDNPNDLPELDYNQVKQLFKHCEKNSCSLKEGFATLFGMDMLSQKEQLIFASGPDVYVADANAKQAIETVDMEAKLAEFKKKLATQHVPTTQPIILKK